MVTNNVDFIQDFFHQVSPDIDSENAIEHFCQRIAQIPEHLNIFHMDMFMTLNLDGIIYTITLVSEHPIKQKDLNDVQNWAFDVFPDEDIRSAKAVEISGHNNLMQVTLSITFND